MHPCPSIAARRAGRARGRTSAASLVYRVSGVAANTQLLQSVLMHFSHSGALWSKVQQHSSAEWFPSVVAWYSSHHVWARAAL